MTDYCRYADVFYGSGETNVFPAEGIAARWFYIKAQCGNTTPHAVLPFGKISVGAYSGGYPTGYGNHCPNFCGGVKKFSKKMKIRGFSHLHQTGTGAIAYYYNYAVVTPFSGDLSEILEFRDIKNEYAVPGFYSVSLSDIKASLTATDDVAFHKYEFSGDSSKVAVDFSNDGLLKEFGTYHGFAKDAYIKRTEQNTVFFSGILSGIKLYFCVKAEGENVSSSLFTDTKLREEKEITISDTEKSFGGVFTSDSDTIYIKVSYSTIGFEEAEKAVDCCTASFEETKKSAYDKWNKYLSAFKIETSDDTLREKFYSNLYHSLIKPCILTGENVLGVKGDVVTDLGTFWDQYKTLLPLIYMTYKDEGRKIADAIINISCTLGKVSCSFGLTDKLPCEQQAKMLGVITLCDAYHMGLCSKEDIDECVNRELQRDDYKVFLETGLFERYTHILDVTDACLDVAEITDNEELKNTLPAIAKGWAKAYDSDALMSQNSPYYEGDRYTYSFRLQNNMEERVALAGGKEKFASMLDSFFGFGKEKVEPVTALENAGAIIKERACHRFEGFNNECDMETPFSYIFAGRHDRLCEIVTAACRDSYLTGRNGLPGNNDSGGLSSCFVYMALGIFPWAGRGKFLIGCPQIDKAEISLSNGKTLKIETQKKSPSDYIVREVYFKDKKITDFTIDAEELLGGGVLKIIF